MPDTHTGKEVENFIEQKLEANGYNIATQVQSAGINSDWSKIDIVLCSYDGEHQKALSIKYQGVPGSVEEKLPYEANSLSLMCIAHGYPKGIIVLCGDGWSPAKYHWFLNIYEPPERVSIISYDEFIRDYIGE